MFFDKKIKFDPNDVNSIISACLLSDRQAQHVLVEKHISYARSVCQIYSRNSMDADEMLNDGFLKIFNNIAKFDQSRPFQAWLRAIFVHTGIDHYRKNKQMDFTIQIDTIHEADISPDILDDLAAEELLLLIQKLPPSYRMVFTLYVIEGYNHREIGELLSIQEGTSKSNLRDARHKLQKMLHSNYDNKFSSHEYKKVTS